MYAWGPLHSSIFYSIIYRPKSLFRQQVTVQIIKKNGDNIDQRQHACNSVQLVNVHSKPNAP